MGTSHRTAVAAAALLLALAVPAFAQGAKAANPQRIILATTTSTEQSGLLGYMLPVFERKTGYKVDVVAVGTGASLKIGEKGDCDIVLVHARALEDAFMAAGWGAERRDVMYNDFIVLGPKDDPAGLAKAKNAKEAFGTIAGKKATFVSRGDNSGTHVKEKDVWKVAGLAPSGSWYKEAGQGMSQVIQMAAQLGGYTLADRATWLAVNKTAPGLDIVYQGDPALLNPYGIIAVNP
ncbi:substrate-binding domain-containing protein, partial [bacterium]|nr:substrate-binding domain-containing protein [bacterium]